MTHPDSAATSAADRRRAVIVAGHRGDAESSRSATTDPDPAVRAAALGALRRTGTLTSDDLRAAMADTDPTVRRRAVELAADDRSIDLVDALADTDATVVEMAAWACGEHESSRPDVVDALAALATDAPDALVREAAVAALGAIGSTRGLPAVLRALEDRATVRRRAVIALAPFDGPQVDRAIDAALADRDWQVRQAAEDLRRPWASHDADPM